jgi:hypothetical protein
MKGIPIGLRTFAGLALTVAAVLIFAPGPATAQDVPPAESTAVADLYKLEDLLPEMSPAELGSIKDIASWCLDMGRLFKDRLAEARKKIDLQREMKKVEIKGLEVRQKQAAQAKDEAGKKAVAAEMKAQRIELDILDAIKELAQQEEALGGDLEAAGKSLRSLAGDFRDLADNRSSALRALEKAKEEALQAALPEPKLVIDYGANEKAQRAVSDAGKNLKDLGDRMIKVSKARQGVASAWERLEKARTEKAK